MEEKAELMTVDNIRSRVYTIRGQQVMLDQDLAEIYGYEVKRLNEQVRRNISRFPGDFMFELSDEEVEICSRSQFVTQSEMGLVTAKVSEMSAKISGLEDWKKQAELRIDALNENFMTDKDIKNFVIYKGQKFEADVAYIDIYQQATSSIYVVDDYVNAKTLQLLSQKREGVEVILFTQNGHGKKGFLTAAVVNDFQNQYPSLRIKSNPDCHDRLIVLDCGLPTEQVFHCGASSKDAGKKLCAINKIYDVSMIHPVMERMLQREDFMIE